MMNPNGMKNINLSEFDVDFYCHFQRKEKLSNESVYILCLGK